MDARAVFEWFPIQRLDGIRPSRELDEMSILPSGYATVATSRYVAVVRRWVDRGWLGGEWSAAYDVDLSQVADEMMRRNGDGVLYRYSADEAPRAAWDRIRDEVNAAAEAVAARYVDQSVRA